MLAYLDSLDLFDRSTEINPFLILDGHGSRFEFDFLEYINKNEHKWNVNIGLHYGTSKMSDDGDDDLLMMITGSTEGNTEQLSTEV
jgi:hypothetical protein